jgi:hypothetical protein
VKFKAIFPYLLTTGLGVTGVVYSSPLWAYAAVASLLVSFAHDAFDRYLDTKSVKTGVPDEAKRRIVDLETRVTTIEVGIQRRGF